MRISGSGPIKIVYLCTILNGSTGEKGGVLGGEKVTFNVRIGGSDWLSGSHIA